MKNNSLSCEEMAYVEEKLTSLERTVFRDGEDSVRFAQAKEIVAEHSGISEKYELVCVRDEQRRNYDELRSEIWQLFKRCDKKFNSSLFDRLFHVYYALRYTGNMENAVLHD